MRDLGFGAGVTDPSKVHFHFWVLVAVYAAIAAPCLISIEPSPIHIAVTVMLGAVLAVLSAIDIDCLRLPDELTLPLVVAGLGFSVLSHWDDPWLRLLAAMAGYGVLWVVARGYEFLRGRAGLGLGDAKLFAAAGAWVGFEGLASVLLYASLTALVWAAVCSIRGQAVSGAMRLPFGPFLALGLWWVWLYGPATFAI